MELLSALNWRYAVKKFSDAQLPEDRLMPLLEATRLSASSYGLQPFNMVVIRSVGVREALLNYAYGQRKVLESSCLVVFAAHTTIDDRLVDRYLDQLVSARGTDSQTIQGYGDHIKQVLADKSERERVAWSREQVFIALGTFLSAAALYRVDTCPMTGFDAAGFDRVLGLAASQLTATAICAVGVRSPDDETATYPKVRVPFEEWASFV